MIEIAALASIMGPLPAGQEYAAPLAGSNAAEGSGTPKSFMDMLSGTVDAAQEKIAEADDMVQKFALDDNIPLHEVTIALQEARLSVELMMQVRARMLESYRDFMNMQI